jgi:hypothetical protein
MLSKIKTALAALFILGPVSVVVLAGPNNRTDGHGSVRTVLISNGRTGVVNHAAKPFAAELGPPFCLKTASGTTNCSYHSLTLCEQARHPNSLDQCIPRFQAGG